MKKCYFKLEKLIKELCPDMKVIDMNEFMASDNPQFDIWLSIHQTTDTEIWRYDVSFNVFPKIMFKNG